jgi:ABC-type multidrug transport system fused ATPase/permease subunit
MDGSVGDMIVNNRIEITFMHNLLIVLTGLGSVIVFAATLFALREGVTDGSTAIVIVQAGIFSEASRQLVKFVEIMRSNCVLLLNRSCILSRVAAQLELDFNSIERVIEYFDVPQEAPAIIEKNRPPAYWPSSDGELRVENLFVRYASHLPFVLRNISFVVKRSEKIGVVRDSCFSSNMIYLFQL